jgi:hypothetical protein
MTTLLTGVKAIITGTNITPPPIPAITDTTAREKLIRKNASSQRVIAALPISPAAGTWLRYEIIESPINESATAASIIVNSSQGFLANLKIPIFKTHYT